MHEWGGGGQAARGLQSLHGAVLPIHLVPTAVGNCAAVAPAKRYTWMSAYACP